MNYLKEVQNIEIGDILMSVDSMSELYNNGYYTPSTTVVTSNAIFYRDSVIDFNNGLLKTSKDHQHVVKHNNVWSIKPADEIVIGDILLDKNNNEIEIISIIIDNTPQSVYNISVDGEHVFFANGILTHNKFILCCKDNEYGICFEYIVSFGTCESYGYITCSSGECSIQ
jgi:hypothetical protein